MKKSEEIKDFIKKEISFREECKSRLFKGNSEWNRHDSVIYTYEEILDFIDSE